VALVVLASAALSIRDMAFVAQRALTFLFGRFL
jgi:hypothetical protein